LSAITEWGPKGARGSRAQYERLIAAAIDVRNDISQLADYASNTQPNNPNSWLKLGLTLKGTGSKPPQLAAVQNFHQVISNKIVAGTIKLDWERPLDTSFHSVTGYVVQASSQAVEPSLSSVNSNGIAAIVTSTSANIDIPFEGPNYFWVTPFNSIGYGVSSEAVFFNAPKKI
jgi:hypothetical protein